MKEIAETRVRYGFNRIHILLRREGWRDNHKRTYRIYKGRRAEFKEQATAPQQDRGASSAATAADWTPPVLEHGFRQ